jgi:hypothetical protein
MSLHTIDMKLPKEKLPKEKGSLPFLAEKN